MLDVILSVVLLRYDVLIQAGHEGRPASCAVFHPKHCNLGALDEREWTPIVADTATEILRDHGVSVARVPADFAGKYRVDAAVFVHFDSGWPRCSSRASIGYKSDRDEQAAQEWRALYSRYWPFGFKRDNFTSNLRKYYEYKQVDARDGRLVLELGETTCKAQREWLAPRLQWEGALLAYFLSQLTGIGDVPLPPMPQVSPAPAGGTTNHP
jgi:hypothetical protein